MDNQYDVAIIGSGPGGYVSAIRASQLGLKAVVIEREFAGGVCLNVGCIPTKTMLRSAEVFSTMQSAEKYGILADNVRLDYGAVTRRRDQVVAGLRKGVEGLLKSNQVEMIFGNATLQGRNAIQVDVQGGEGRALQARTIVIATGSRPAVLPISGSDKAGVVNSTQALELQQAPKSVLVIGGGAVGCEWASIFRAFGADVTVVEMLPNLLPLEDEDMGKTLERLFKKDGISIHTGATVQGIEDAPDGGKRSTVAWADGRTVQVESEIVMLGVGRTPNTDGLGLDSVGVTPNRRGFLDVDEHLRIGDSGLYAIGDVTGVYLLAHVASHQGIIAAENIAGEDTTIDYRAVPAVTFTHPEVASVGLTEAKARETGHDLQIGKFPFAALGRAQTYGDTDGMAKIVADSKYGQILGVHIIGPNAGDLIPEAVLGISLEATVEDLANTIHAHPTFPEALMESSLNAMGRAIHVANSPPGVTLLPGRLLDLPLTDYLAALGLQQRSVEARRLDLAPETLILVEHPPVFTLGRRGRRSDVYVPDAELAQLGITLHAISRGGLTTYHGPGQVVGYPIVRLRSLGRDVPGYVSGLQRVIVGALAEEGVHAGTRAGLPGVWTASGKIAAIGIAMQRGITMHGFAVNLQPNLSHFTLIDPCGLSAFGVTSAATILGHAVDQAGFRARLVRHFAAEFGVDLGVPEPGHLA